VRDSLSVQARCETARLHSDRRDYHVATDGGLDSNCPSLVRYCRGRSFLEAPIHPSRLPSTAQCEENIRLIVGKRLVGGGDRRFGGCEACLDVE
jgi:hypothetical protein